MATTSLGRLTLDLAVKLSEFVDGMSRAERETKEKTEKMTKSVNSFKENLVDALGGSRVGGAIDGLNSKLGSLKGGVGVAGAALAGMAAGAAVVAAGAITKLAIETARADAELVVLANRANTSVRNFQVLGRASEQLGVSQEQLGDILADVQEKLGEFSATEGGGAADFFEALQNNTSLTTDEIRELGRVVQGKDGVEAIQLLKDKMDELGATSQEQRFVFESLASDLGNLLPLFENGGDLLNRYGAELEAAGVIKTAEAIEQSQRLAAQTEALHIRYDGLKQQLASQMMPVLNNLLGYFSDGSNKGNLFSKVIRGIGYAAKFAGTIIVGLASGISALVSTLGSVYKQFANIARTGKAFWQADGVLAKIEALNDGMANAQGIHADTVTDITGNFMSAINSVKGMWTETVAEGDDLSSALYEIKNAGVEAGRGLSYSTKQADEMAKASEKAAKATKKQTKELSRMEQVHAAFVKAGLSDNQARIITAEVGREGSFLDKNLFGYHKDPHNGAINAGMISWQGDRGKALIRYLTELGLVKNGKIMTTQEALDAQAMFVVKEITSNKRFNATKNQFLSNPDVSYQDGNRVLGKNYIAWRYDDPRYNSGHRNRDKYYNQLNAKLGNKGLSNDIAKQLQDEQKEAEKLAKDQQSIRERYMDEREKSISEHNKRIAEINEKFGKDSTEAAVLRAEEEARFQEEQAERVHSIMGRYQTEEEKLVYEHQQILQEIKNKFAEDSPEYALALEAQEVYFREEMQRIRQQDAAKFIQQQQYIESVKRLIEQSNFDIAASVNDTIARATMSPEEYQRYSLGSQQDSAIAGVNDRYAEREAEINRINELGEYEIASAGARYELLQEAKREHEAAMYAVELEYAEKRKELQKQESDMRMQATGEMFSGMSSLTAMFFGEQSKEHRAAIAAQRAFAIAQVLMNAPKTASDAYAALAPIPIVGPALGIAAAAAAITTQLGYAAQLKSTNVSGIAHGGLDYVPSESTYLLDKGERVLSPNQNKDLTNFMKNGGTGSPQINIINNAPGYEAVTTTNADGSIDVKIEKRIQQSWSNLQNPNSHESKMLGRNVQAPRRR